MDREEIFRITLRKFLEPVVPFLDDASITEIMINGPTEIYIERGGKIEKVDAAFYDEELLLAAARNIAQYTNKRINENTSRFDSRLPDGYRVHVVLPRCSRKGLAISIRKFSKKSFTLEGLVESGSLSPEAKEYVEIVVELEKNLIVAGGTGSGKTSLLNAISTKIPSTERIIVIEDTSELQLQQPHVLSFETVGPDRHGKGAVTIRDLFHSALRMRPDRIVIGECRGGEALDLIQAMTSGHGGSMSTLHATTCADALNRLETMALMSGIEIPLSALRAQIGSAIDVIVQLTKLNDGKRVISEISEVIGISENGQFRLNPLFELTTQESGRTIDPVICLKWTENQSVYDDEITLKGLTNKVKLTSKLFQNHIKQRQ